MSDQQRGTVVGRWGPVALAVVLCGLFFFRALSSSGVFLGGDALRVFLPMRAYWASRVSALEFPDWLPYDGLGQSFPGIFITGTFHPLMWPHLVLPLGLAAKVALLGCFLLALGGTYALVRAWDVPRAGALFAGVTFAFCGYLVCITNNPTYLQAASTLPGVLWLALRFLRQPDLARLTLAGMGLALLAFAGDAQAFVMANALIVCLTALEPHAGPWRRRVTACALLILAGGLLAAPQLLPAAALVSGSEPGARSLGEAQRFSLHPLRLWELVLGPFLADARGTQGIPYVVVTHLVPSGGFGRAWVDSVYLGTPAWVLALAGLAASARQWRAWAFVGLWGVLLALCLGDALPVYGWAYHLIPFWKPFRYPEKLVPLVSLGLAVAAGLGWKRCLGAGGPVRPVVWVGALMALPFAGVALAEGRGQWWSEHWLRARWPDVPGPVLRGLSDNVVATTATAALLAFACAALALLRERPALRGSLLVVLQWGALTWAHEPLYQLSPEELLSTPPAFVEHIRARFPSPEPVRVASSLRETTPPRLPGLNYHDSLHLTLLSALAPDMVAMWGLESANEYLPGVSPRVRQLKADRVQWFTRLAPRLGTRFLAYATSEHAAFAARLSVRSTFTDPLLGLTLVEYADAVPRVLLARPECVAGRDEAARRMLSATLPPPDVALVECTAPLPATPEGPLGPVRVLPGTPEHLTVEVDARAPAVLVVNDAFQPGWRATLDGQDVAILPANVAVRAVAVPAGRHVVELRYRTPGLTAGLIVGAAAWVGLLLACLGTRYVPRRRAAGG
ncbi:YfhO family protein [Corallococcus macrosporus]|uniref:YfhO family protein n=1 Tax=Corallococcus macrosporus TaxID=35 RepID=A0ABS3D3M0_9BACT|nr:YfhO family protein [Corallococcus macrosporus]MBN8226219.1 YfhO family protein [Corallococcus macrosporus]